MKSLTQPRQKMHPTLARLPAALLGLAIALSASGEAFAGSQSTTTDAFWLWNPAAIVGDAKLVRTETGVSARWSSLGLPKGSAVTLWFVVFNNPAECATTPCGAPDLFNPAVQGDFLLGGGHVIGANGMANFGGHLSLGDASGSGHIEIGFPGLAVGLTNPYGAEVHLLLHSHGPAKTGQMLKSQISSFLGGCTTFLGPDGFAAGPGDVPDEDGECSTIQASIHMP
ncbi:hypothetical protein [Luteimonas vadosa]|uniref:CHRD domain-containing protein n=1 Tax=Luteimonas vadosa TaxID=1165507 RepID=A0ABP9E7G5_9GAMM